MGFGVKCDKMYVTEQAVQGFKLVTNCLCSDRNTPIITVPLCLCNDAVTNILVHLYLSVQALGTMAVVSYRGCHGTPVGISCVFVYFCSCPSQDLRAEVMCCAMLFRSLSSCSSVILIDSFPVRFCSTASGKPSPSCPGSSRSCCWRCCFLLFIFLVCFGCFT